MTYTHTHTHTHTHTKGTSALCRRLYREEVDEALVRAFLARRFLFCVLTSGATVLQIALLAAGVPQVNFFLLMSVRGQA